MATPVTSRHRLCSDSIGLYFREIPIVLVIFGIVAVSVAGLPRETLGGDSSRVVRAESDDREERGDDSEEVEEAPDRFRRTTKSESKSNRVPASSDGPGVIGQAGHLAFKTFGRNESITPIEVLPYILTDEHFFFSDMRGFVSNSALFGGNIGLGYRNLREDYNAWFGGSVWYDADGTSGKLFQQIGLSFEGLIERWEFRSNVYLPVTQSQNFANTTGGARIVGHQLLYSQYVDQGKALRGVDVEAGYNLPVMDKYRLRGFVGYYHFDGSSGGAINGFKTRVEGVINNTVTAQVMYTNDRLFGSNVMVGLQMMFPFGDNHPASKWKENTPSPFRFVERNYNVIVDHAQSMDGSKVAMNPTTNAAYNIQQISTGGAANSANPSSAFAPSSADGTTANPFSTIAAAQAAGADVIFVQGNSVLTESITLAANQHLLGDGSNQSLALAGGGSIRLPNLIAAAQTPRFDGVNGPAVTLGSNSEFAGFTIANNVGNAVVGNNVAGASIHDVTFQNITGHAIYLNSPSGDFVLNNITVNNAAGTGLDVIGGTANLTFSGTVSGANGYGILLSNMSQGAININNTSLQGTGLAGLKLDNVATDVTVRSLTTSQTSGPAVAISGGSAADTYHFTNVTTINQPNGMGFSVASTPATVAVDSLKVTSTAGSAAVSLTNASGPVTLSSLNVQTTNATGLYARNASLLTVAGGSISTVGAAAVDIQASTINSTLGNVSVNGGPFGISLVQTVGQFNVLGAGGYATGGTIQNTNTAGLILNKAGTVNINWMDLISNAVAVQSSNNTQVSLTGLRVTGSTGYAIDSLDDSVLTIKNSTLTGNGALGGGTIRAQADNVASYQWLVQGNQISDHNGAAIQLISLPTGTGASLGTTVQQNTIVADRGTATLVDINWNGPLSVSVASNTLTAGASGMTGISVKNASTTDSTSAHINSNSLVFTDIQSAGIYVAAAASSTLQADNNGVDFKGTGGTGLRFNLTGTSTDWFYSNTITDEAGGATGMLFDHVATNTRLQIEANLINLLSTDLTVHRGIIFSTVDPTVQLLGNYDNIINYASPGLSFSIPVNSTTGRISVNGVLVP